jgi:hypothetical protein
MTNVPNNRRSEEVIDLRLAMLISEFQAEKAREWTGNYGFMATDWGQFSTVDGYWRICSINA